ncbi:hypothetical protein CBER1_07391 [Cercospora berteroae]|uniref:Reverse transcriptase domain-containing protein n=1 Tax=Cercospora berteroae TaxID=357750 RepID=A0A2S6CMU0_9PEZI|nr:hypothetical protein CBER1_07391 [Cercospora berteroae]
MPSITPAIVDPETGTEVAEASGKAALFRNTFFSEPPHADLNDIASAQYPEPIPLPRITEKEVIEAITSSKAFKAPGLDQITNKALQAGRLALASHLTNIFNSSIDLAYCTAHFRRSTTVVLRKPGKDNYTTPKAYRPIALLNTIGKIMDALLARRLSYIAETYDLLPRAHIGGRRQKSTEHALHNIIDKVHHAWNTGQVQVASLLLLDVSGAFDNVSHERLLHDLRARRVDERLVRWIASFLSNRSTNIVVDGFQSRPYTVSTGIPQGSPLSPILYIYYNSSLIQPSNTDTDPEGTTAVTGYIDDAALLAWGDSTEDTCSQLEDMLEKAQHWAHAHASKFAPEKFQLTHFTRSRTRFDLEKGIETAWCNIAPKATCKYLSVTIDTKLHWKSHIEAMQRKVSSTIGALHSLGSSTWGVKMLEMRKIYRGVAIPQMMYACSLWSRGRTSGCGYTKQTLQTLQALQARPARTICGAYRATSAAALNIETFLLPVEQQIEKHNADAVVRMLASKDPGTVQTRAISARRNRYTSPFERIRRSFAAHAAIDLGTSEHIPPFVAAPWRTGPTIYIDNAEEARSRHDIESEKAENICIYADGSGIGGCIGAAAVCLTANRIERTYMGTDATSTVYAAELQGINLALQIAQNTLEDTSSPRQVAIRTDNQAAIRSLVRAEGRSGAYILKQIACRTDTLQDKGHTVIVRWIPSHEGIEGNEAADIAAKEATGWREGQDGSEAADRAAQPEELYAVLSTLKRKSREEAEKKWQGTWRTGTTGRSSFRYTPIPSKRTLQLHSGLSKRESALLVQLRTEKVGLKDFLFNRNVPGVRDSLCHCREGRQTVRHVVLTCRRLRDLRKEHLGGLPGRTNLRGILNSHKLATKTIRFIEQAQILGHNGIGEE